MSDRFRSYGFLIFSLGLLLFALPVRAQLGNSGSIDGVVKDQSGASVPNARAAVNALAVAGARLLLSCSASRRTAI